MSKKRKHVSHVSDECWGWCTNHLKDTMSMTKEEFSAMYIKPVAEQQVKEFINKYGYNPNG